MKTNNSTSKILFVFALVLNISLFGQRLDENLKILEPLLNKNWVGELQSPGGGESWKTTRKFITLWDDSIIKYISSTPERNSFAEGFIYWDREEKRISVLILNERGIYQKGFISEEEGIISIKGKISFPEKAFDFKNTFKITKEGKLIDRWFQNAFGSWMAGHVIGFTAIDSIE